jgi:hypothetical protein
LYDDFSKVLRSPLIFISKRKLAGKHGEADKKVMEEICGTFEVISKRKLAGKHDEADKKVMEEICGKREDPPDDIDDEESNSDVDESSSETDEDFDESHGKKTVRKTRARDE